MSVLHSKHTYRPQRPVRGPESILVFHLVFALNLLCVVCLLLSVLRFVCALCVIVCDVYYLKFEVFTAVTMKNAVSGI
jgi:hypothetical protein